MPDAYVIEVEGRTAGIVARDSHEHSFNFFAATHPFNAMEGQSFADPLAAEQAARRLARNGSSRRPAEEDRAASQNGGDKPSSDP